jgi:hypothetical protein
MKHVHPDSIAAIAAPHNAKISSFSFGTPEVLHVIYAFA